ncbi:hypothetical protein CTAYLR_010804 [Chrysophaeum taylorii]|uniref:ATP synthase F1 complex delta/epsilon subunit N-terminal domain-containing protein n=1 Tax=Chrysophaeum taylorii TaxID=2483200 RepID=A0AAD7UJI7_9STRA|nr:hypothetical protein CTAYLR_010804 [Chrysophaeum taylorii]
MKLSFASPAQSYYFEEAVESVTLPGVSGEYGVTGGHSKLCEQLKPGVVAVGSEKYFVSGGFALTDAEKTEVSVVEAVKLEDLDADKVKKVYAKATADQDQVTAETAKAMATALGIQL